MLTRTVDFRYIVVRNGADFSELQPIRNGEPLIYMDESAEIKMSLSGDFAQNDAVNWLTDQIRPELEINGIRKPLGVFLPATVTPMSDESTRSVHVEAYDRCWLVRDNYTETILHFAAGAKYTTIVKQLLTVSGVVTMIVTPSNAVLAEAREDWGIGTSLLTIVNDLLAEINYNPLWFDASGAAVVEPASVPTAENIDHTLDNSEVKSMLLPQLRREADIYSAPNVFRCVVSNADKSAAMVATAENNNLQSPLSIARRGRRIVKVVNVDNIASQAELQAYADRLRNESLFTGETITVKTALLPDYGVADVVALHYDDVAAICIDRAWTMELRVGGSMTHTLERVVIALD
jgi:hypothetical protein